MVFRPIVIAAHLRCGVVSDPWLPLDGILLYQAVRKRYGGPPPASIPGRGSLEVAEHAPTLPLKLIQDGKYRYWACSFAEWGRPYGEGRDYWNKREDSGRYGHLLDPAVKRIETGKGRYKAYHMPVFYRVAPYVRWWAVGDPDGVRELLRGVDAIGKKRAYGWGEVITWQVEMVAEDRSVLVDGVPQRSLPVTENTSGQVAADTVQAFWGYYPPYYDPANQTVCFMPQGLRKAQEPSTLVAMGRAEQDVGGEEVC
jgi:hypothetical protein